MVLKLSSFKYFRQHSIAIPYVIHPFLYRITASTPVAKMDSLVYEILSRYGYALTFGFETQAVPLPPFLCSFGVVGIYSEMHASYLFFKRSDIALLLLIQTQVAPGALPFRYNISIGKGLAMVCNMLMPCCC